jgi:hypothetical protein
MKATNKKGALLMHLFILIIIPDLAATISARTTTVTAITTTCGTTCAGFACANFAIAIRVGAFL